MEDWTRSDGKPNRHPDKEKLSTNLSLLKYAVYATQCLGILICREEKI
jgi:hypothetical protein